MDLRDAALLGLVQGLTEFLPVSSSAHLIIARAFFGWDAGEFGLAFDVAVHIGTLLAVVVYFRRDLWAMAASIPGLLKGECGSPAARVLLLIVAGTAPIVVVGLSLADVLERTLRTPEVAAAALAAGGVALWWVERVARRRRGEESLSFTEAVAIGVAQSAALVPGVSRSGATITVGMLIGLRREAAARFGFLLGVPAILAAGVKEGLALAAAGPGEATLGLLVVGAASSAVVGYVTVSYFLWYLARHSLRVFAVYRLLLAGTVFGWLAWP